MPRFKILRVDELGLTLRVDLDQIPPSQFMEPSPTDGPEVWWPLDSDDGEPATASTNRPGKRQKTDDRISPRGTKRGRGRPRKSDAQDQPVEPIPSQPRKTVVDSVTTVRRSVRVTEKRSEEAKQQRRHEELLASVPVQSNATSAIRNSNRVLSAAQLGTRSRKTSDGALTLKQGAPGKPEEFRWTSGFKSGEIVMVPLREHKLASAGNFWWPCYVVRKWLCNEPERQKSTLAGTLTDEGFLKDYVEGNRHAGFVDSPMAPSYKRTKREPHPHEDTPYAIEPPLISRASLRKEYARQFGKDWLYDKGVDDIENMDYTRVRGIGKADTYEWDQKAKARAARAEQKRHRERNIPADPLVAQPVNCYAPQEQEEVVTEEDWSAIATGVSEFRPQTPSPPMPHGKKREIDDDVYSSASSHEQKRQKRYSTDETVSGDPDAASTSPSTRSPSHPDDVHSRESSPAVAADWDQCDRYEPGAKPVLRYMYLLRALPAKRLGLALTGEDHTYIIAPEHRLVPWIAGPHDVRDDSYYDKAALQAIVIASSWAVEDDTADNEKRWLHSNRGIGAVYRRILGDAGVWKWPRLPVLLTVYDTASMLTTTGTNTGDAPLKPRDRDRDTAKQRMLSIFRLGTERISVGDLIRIVKQSPARRGRLTKWITGTETVEDYEYMQVNAIQLTGITSDKYVSLPGKTIMVTGEIFVRVDSEGRIVKTLDKGVPTRSLRFLGTGEVRTVDKKHIGGRYYPDFPRLTGRMPVSERQLWSGESRGCNSYRGVAVVIHRELE
ncbi:hypothetical protein BC832DRAFT_538811 [Gaertneriomyces semiglobifer]|nr:hypothetical protein BC832DRAFT_538811 [Gaertneriomyces semiglobifer]